MLPHAYQRWIGEWLATEIPEETQATCDRCAMAAPPGTPQTTSAMTGFFGANKCCTYFPSLPNFQVGSILGAADEGSQRVVARIRGGVGVDPIWVRSGKQRAELYRIGMVAGFGRAEAFRCPYYVVEGGGCSVWRHREAVCSTYYCKLESPVKGRVFWGELKSLLVLLETTVAVHCAMELGIPSAIVDQLLLDPGSSMKSAADVDGLPDAELQARLWGSWLGREESYYLECAQRSEVLDLAAIRALGGIAFERKLATVRTAFEALLSNPMPDRMRSADMLQISTGAPGRIRIHAGPTQPIEMPIQVLELLGYFRGQPLDEAMATLVENGFDVEKDFLAELWKSGFLVAATE